MRLKHTGLGSFAGRSSFSQLRKSPEKDPPKATPAIILVTRQTGGIGDILMITPTVRAIKQANPNSPLIFCTTDMYGGGKGALFDILKYNPWIDKVVTNSELSDYTFKRIYNFGTGQEIEKELSGDKRNRIDIFAELAGIELTDKSTVYTLREAEKEWSERWIKKNINPDRKFLIGVQIHSTATKRNWPEEKIRLLTLTILNTWQDSSVLLFYEGLVSTDKFSYPNVHNLIGMPIRWVAALLNECQVVVVPDSGLLHLAGALNKKIIGLFGSIPPELRISHYKNATSIYLEWPCSPCWYERCLHHHGCMENISVDMVMEKLEEVLNREVIKKKFGSKILVVRMGGVGDLIMLTPSLREVNKLYGSKIVLGTVPANIPVLEGLPYIDKIVPIGLAENEPVDSIVDLRYKVESPEVGGTLNTKLYTSVNRIDMFARLMKVNLKDRKVDVAVSPDKVLEMKALIQYDSKYKYLGIQATCTSNLRTIPPEYVPGLIKKFTKIRNLKVVIFGRSEFWYGRQPLVDLKRIKGRKIINLMGKTSDVGSLVALCSIMNYIVAPDSSTVHIAAALGISCIALFGNMSPYLRVAYYPTVISMYPKEELPCIPCWDFRNPCLVYEKMPTETQPIGAACMRQLTPDRIFETAEENWFKKGE